MLKKTLTALTLASTLLSAPAFAGGSVSLHISPGGGQNANILRTGLALYGIVNDIQSNGHVTQRGIGNAAALAQRGGGNLGLIHQEGTGHNGSLRQNGYGNAYGLFQFGRGTNAQVSQYGYGGTGVTVQYGW